MPGRQRPGSCTQQRCSSGRHCCACPGHRAQAKQHVPDCRRPNAGRRPHVEDSRESRRRSLRRNRAFHEHPRSASARSSRLRSDPDTMIPRRSTRGFSPQPCTRRRHEAHRTCHATSVTAPKAKLTGVPRHGADLTGSRLRERSTGPRRRAGARRGPSTASAPVQADRASESPIGCAAGAGPQVREVVDSRHGVVLTGGLEETPLPRCPGIRGVSGGCKCPTSGGRTCPTWRVPVTAGSGRAEA